MQGAYNQFKKNNTEIPVNHAEAYKGCCYSFPGVTNYEPLLVGLGIWEVITGCVVTVNSKICIEN
jgi:hypothetical protein